MYDGEGMRGVWEGVLVLFPPSSATACLRLDCFSTLAFPSSPSPGHSRIAYTVLAYRLTAWSTQLFLAPTVVTLG